MDLPFDTQKADNTLAATREREEEDVANILSAKYGIGYADLSLTAIDTDALRIIPEERAKEAHAAAFAKTAQHLSVAIANPNNPELAALLSELASRGYEVKEVLVSEKSLEKALAHYTDLSYAAENRAGVFSAAKNSTAIASLAELKSRLDTALSERSLDREWRVL